MLDIFSVNISVLGPGCQCPLVAGLMQPVQARAGQARWWSDQCVPVVSVSRLRSSDGHWRAPCHNIYMWWWPRPVSGPSDTWWWMDCAQKARVCWLLGPPGATWAWPHVMSQLSSLSGSGLSAGQAGEPRTGTTNLYFYFPLSLLVPRSQVLRLRN